MLITTTARSNTLFLLRFRLRSSLIPSPLSSSSLLSSAATSSPSSSTTTTASSRSSSSCIMYNRHRRGYSTTSSSSSSFVQQHHQQQQQQQRQQFSTESSHDAESLSNEQEGPTLLDGIVLDHAVDLRNVKVGDRLDIPYELTVTDTFYDLWFSSFFDNSRVHTSRPFCRNMGLQDRVLPFSMAVFLTASMSHADAAKVQVGFGRVNYLWPIFAGDTLRKAFTVTSIRNTSDGNHSVISFKCDLINQRDRLCMRADKRLLFQFPIPEATNDAFDYNFDDNNNNQGNTIDEHLFRDHLVSKANTVLMEQPSHSLADLRPGELYFHSNMHRCLTMTQTQQLASLAKLTHHRHFDVRSYSPQNEILIPGGLVLGLTLSASARDFHEVLHEEVVSAAYANSLHPDNVVGAISYVSNVDDNTLPGNLQLVTLTTLGIKNIHVKRDLIDCSGIPLELFQPGIYGKEMERICKESCPILSNKIVVQVQRKILRQARHKEVFLL